MRDKIAGISVLQNHMRSIIHRDVLNYVSDQLWDQVLELVWYQMGIEVKDFLDKEIG